MTRDPHVIRGLLAIGYSLTAVARWAGMSPLDVHRIALGFAV